MATQTLRLVKYLCDKGAHDFRRAMARQSSAIRCPPTYLLGASAWRSRCLHGSCFRCFSRSRACMHTYLETAYRELTHYRGEPDPFKGDVPNQKVRNMAREAIDALFNDNNYAEQAAAPAPALTVCSLMHTPACGPLQPRLAV